VYLERKVQEFERRELQAWRVWVRRTGKNQWQSGGRWEGAEPVEEEELPAQVWDGFEKALRWRDGGKSTCLCPQTQDHPGSEKLRKYFLVYFLKCFRSDLGVLKKSFICDIVHVMCIKSLVSDHSHIMLIMSIMLFSNMIIRFCMILWISCWV